MPLTIAHVNDVAWVASTLAAAQQRRGDTVARIDIPKPGAALRYPWKLAAVALRLPILAAIGLRIRRRRVTIVHVHYATQGFVGPLTGRPFVVHCHGSDVRGVGPRGLRGRLLAAILGQASLVLYSTPDLEPDVRSLRADAVFLPNPVDLDLFSPGGVPERDVLMATRLDSGKGAEIAIEAIRRVLLDRPSTTVTVVANGPLAPLARARLGDTVVFVEPTSRATIPALIRRHRVVIGQFRVGAIGMLELEAMACGRPVIASFRFPDAYPEPPPIEQAQTTDEVAASIVRLLDDPERCRRLSESGPPWVARHHGSDAVAARLDTLYRDVLP